MMLQFKKLDSNLNLNKVNFNSDIASLQNFFFKESLDFIKEGYSQIYLLKEKEGNNIIGYFAISCGLIEFRKEIGIEKKHNYIPSLLIGRLAVDKNHQRKGYGKDLLKKAINLSLSISSKVGCRLVIVDARSNLNVLNFYKNMKFRYLKKLSAEKIERALQKNLHPTESTVKMYFDLHQIKKT